MTLNKGLGWVPDLPDVRDEKYLFSTALDQELKSEADLPIRDNVVWHYSSKQPNRNVDDLPRRDQTTTSSCTGQSSANMVDLVSGLKPRSALELYWLGREAIGQTDRDEGAQIRDVIQGMCNKGAGAEEYWPFDADKVLERPSDKEWDSASKHKITTYHRLQTRQDFLSCLAEHYPFVIGFTCYEDFVSPGSDVARTGVQNYPNGRCSVAGGHAVCVIGYDNDFVNSDWGRAAASKGVSVPTKVYIIRNSWGSEWGHNGDFAIDAEYLENINLADDAWTVRYGEKSS